MTPEADVTPVPASSITAWDHEADVVIAGYGIAGAAAVEAARAGADVRLERTARGAVRPRWRAASSTSAAAPHSKSLWLRRFRRQHGGVPQRRDGPGADANRIADYCAGSLAHSTGWSDCGVPFKAEFWAEPGWEPPGDQGLMFTGGENAFPFNTIAEPAPRGHIPQM